MWMFLYTQYIYSLDQIFKSSAIAHLIFYTTSCIHDLFYDKALPRDTKNTR